MIDRFFTTKGDRFTTKGDRRVPSTRRDVKIVGSDGTIVFELKGVEAPESWSDQAVQIVAQKYFAPGETSVFDMVDRVAGTIARWAQWDGYLDESEAETFCDELSYILLHQMASFNSPVWFNVGVEEQPQCSACFINSVEDSMDSILSLAKTEGMLFKYGSGAGSNLSNLRGSSERLSGGGAASGPVSFMRGFDAFAGAIKSGGTTRRAAKMVLLDVDHPDIVEFVECKAIEERKAWALIDAGYSGEFNVAGGAYDSVGFQNANHSVRAPDGFMLAAERDEDWALLPRRGGAEKMVKAKELLRKIAAAAHLCGDPGIQFHTTINRWHTSPHCGEIRASNPCSEYLYLDDTACNLASINLRKFQDESGFDHRGFRRVIRVLILAMDVIVDRASYPTPEIAKNSHNHRPLGLGYSNLGAFLMAAGMPYDSGEARTAAASITSYLSAEAYAMSAEIADKKGGFKAICAESMAKIMEQHRDANDTALRAWHHEPRIWARVLRDAGVVWSTVVAEARAGKIRNSQISVLAPTGTISFMMDCDTTGIEPAISLVSYKKLVGGGKLKIVNKSVKDALIRLGYQDAEQIAAQIAEAGGDPRGKIREEDYGLFHCALPWPGGAKAISWQAHVDMMGAVQPFLSGAISKTVNMPKDSTIEDIEAAYIRAWKRGLKSIAVYRDGCKRTQPVSATGAPAPADLSSPPELSLQSRKPMPAERESITHKFRIGGHKGYMTVGLYPDGSPGEIFLRMAREGSTLGGLVDAYATNFSIALQNGVPIELLCRKARGTRFDPAGFTDHPEIRSATSIVDYVAQWLMFRFGAAPIISDEAPTQPVAIASGPPCLDCGAIMARSGACYTCAQCGATSGCG